MRKIKLNYRGREITPQKDQADIFWCHVDCPQYAVKKGSCKINQTRAGEICQAAMIISMGELKRLKARQSEQWKGISVEKYMNTQSSLFVLGRFLKSLEIDNFLETINRAQKESNEIFPALHLAGAIDLEAARKLAEAARDYLTVFEGLKEGNWIV